MKPADINRMGEEQANRVAYLVAAYIRQTITEQEHDELDEWITSSDENQLLFEELTDPEFIRRGLETMKEADANAIRKRLRGKINLAEKEVAKKKRWMPYSIAASLIVLIGVAIFFMPNKKSRRTKAVVNTGVIKPGGNYATLTLPNGKTINLNEAKNGLLDSTNGNEVLKTAEGQISYENLSNELMKYHVLSTPVGGQYSVTLPDGSRVWLNSMSTLKYPVIFAENERVVELSGEGYFEVATSPGLKATPSRGGQERIPFIVKVGDMRVEVLGTHFNINAYKDETTINTTLLEGKVIVRSQEPEVGSRELKPGEQAKIDKGGAITVISDVNIKEVTAWKDGLFMFKDAPIENVMRQVGRWYDAEIEIDGHIDHHFNATIKRSEPVNKLLEYLEETGRIHFKVEGRKIIVRP